MSPKFPAALRAHGADPAPLLGAYHGLGIGQTIWVLPQERRLRIALVRASCERMGNEGLHAIDRLVQLGSGKVLALRPGLFEGAHRPLSPPPVGIGRPIRPMRNCRHRLDRFLGIDRGDGQHLPVLAGAVFLDQAHPWILNGWPGHLLHYDWSVINGSRCAHSLSSIPNRVAASNAHAPKSRDHTIVLGRLLVRLSHPGRVAEPPLTPFSCSICIFSVLRVIELRHYQTSNLSCE